MMMTFGEMLINIFGKVSKIKMVDILFVIMFFLTIWTIIGLANINLDSKQIKDDINYCDSCQWGWCMEIPHSKECKKIRKAINNIGQNDDKLHSKVEENIDYIEYRSK